MYPHTTKQVLRALRKAEPHRSKDVQLGHSGGTYYWYGGIADKFREQSIHVLRLDHLSLQRWVDDFQARADSIDESLVATIERFLNQILM